MGLRRLVGVHGAPLRLFKKADLILRCSCCLRSGGGGVGEDGGEGGGGGLQVEANATGSGSDEGGRSGDLGDQATTWPFV